MKIEKDGGEDSLACNIREPRGLSSQQIQGRQDWGGSLVAQTCQEESSVASYVIVCLSPGVLTTRDQ